MAAFLVDTNVLVYRFDPRDPGKQTRATEVLRAGLARGEARVPQQAVVEFVAAVTRPLAAAVPGSYLLTRDEACREAEEIVAQYPIVVSSDAHLRLALRGWATYRLSWFDALMWAYAEHHGIPVLCSEDFQHGRLYGTVRVENPFANLGS